MVEQRALWVSTSTETRGGVATYVRAIQQTSLWDDWNIRHVTTHRDGSKWAKIATYARGALMYLVELARFRPTVVHVHSSADTSFIRKAALFWIASAVRIPVILHIHSSDVPGYYNNSPRLIQAVIRATLCRASVVVALAQAPADGLRMLAPTARITTIPNAVRPACRVTQTVGDEPVRVVFLGRIGDHKGTFRLIEAWAQLRGEAATLTIAGDGDVERARRLIRQLGLEDTVEVHQWLSESDVCKLLDQAQIMALPSRNEGQPMAVLEAMARGLCIVASDVGGLGEMIEGGCGVIVSPEDVDGIAAALRRVIQDDGLRARYGAAAYSRVKDRFDVRSVSRQIDALYRQVCR